MDINKKLLENFIKNHLDNVTGLVEGASADEVADLLQDISKESAVQVLRGMEREMGLRCLKRLDPSKAADLLEDLPESNTVMILRQMEEDDRSTILGKFSGKYSGNIKRILEFPETRVGAYIDLKVFVLYGDREVEESLNRMKKTNLKIFPSIPVLSRDQKLTGSVDLKDLMIAERETKLNSIMNTEPFSVRADMDLGYLVSLKDQHEIFYVVDVNGIFLGVITKDIINETMGEKPSFKKEARQASMALGDLYQIGLTSIFQHAAKITDEKKSD